MPERAKDELEIFTGNSNPALAREVCEHLGVRLGEAEVGRFPDGEVMVEVRENVRGGDCFVLQSICTPPNDNLMELLLLMDALRRASAKRITAVIPYFGYARQDRKVAPRVPISAKLVADVITAAGASRVLTVDLHAGQIQGFFNIPVDNLYAMPVLIQYLRKRLEGRRVSVVSPDAGGVERARAFARRLNANLAIIDKRRPRASEVAEMQLVGEVRDSLGAAGRRHDRHRRHDYRGGQGGDERRGDRGAGLRDPSDPLRPGLRAAEQVVHQGTDHHQHHPAARQGAGGTRLAQGSVGGEPYSGSHPAHT